jgi:tRNA threonylcarbamoyladenosine biosynthesis protein TsaB
MLLALDTSTSFASVALVRDDRLVAELSWDSGRSHSQDLFRNLHWLLADRRVTVADLTAVAVATGPGSFNGVRVAVTAAKSLSFALGVPLLAFPTLDVVGWGACTSMFAESAGSAESGGIDAPGTQEGKEAGAFSGTVWAVLEAGRGQIYAAEYHGVVVVNEIWKPLNGYHLLAPPELAARISASGSASPVVFCGELASSTVAQLAGLLGTRARFAHLLPSRRASWLAELALAQSSRGEASDIMSLEPLYLRRPAITRSAKLSLPSQAAGGNRAGDSEGTQEKRGSIACATS